MEELKRLVCVDKEQLEWQLYVEPELEPGQVRVKSEHSVSKHGTEMAAYKGYELARGAYDRSSQLFGELEAADYYPVRAGNMFVGRITAKHSDVEELDLGDEVFGRGGFSTTHTVAAGSCRRLPAGISWQSAVCVDPTEFALGAVRDAQIRVGDNVAVFGLGAIGLMVVQLARIAGVKRVIGVEPIAKRREIARILGADDLIDPMEADAGAEIKRLTGGRGADACIEYSGSRSGLQSAIRGVAFGGAVVAGAYPKPYDAGLDFGGEAHINRPSLIFSRANSDPSRDHPRWNHARIIEASLELLAQGKISGDLVVAPVVPFDDLLEHYPKIATDPSAYIKLGAKH